LNDLVGLFVILAFLAGVVGIVALWTQHDINRQRERDAAAKKAADDHTTA
jgi:hypothetical protein